MWRQIYPRQSLAAVLPSAQDKVSAIEWSLRSTSLALDKISARHNPAQARFDAYLTLSRILQINFRTVSMQINPGLIQINSPRITPNRTQTQTVDLSNVLRTLLQLQLEFNSDTYSDSNCDWDSDSNFETDSDSILPFTRLSLHLVLALF